MSIYTNMPCYDVGSADFNVLLLILLKEQTRQKSFVEPEEIQDIHSAFKFINIESVKSLVNYTALLISFNLVWYGLQNSVSYEHGALKKRQPFFALANLGIYILSSAMQKQKGRRQRLQISNQERNIQKFLTRLFSHSTLQVNSLPSTRQEIPHVLKNYKVQQGHAVAQLVEALRHKPEGRGFDSRWCQWIYSLT